MRAAAGLVDAQQLPKLLAGRDLFFRQFASPEKVGLEFLAKLGVLPLFLRIGFAAAPGWWLVIFTSHGSAPLVHKKEVCGKVPHTVIRQRELSGSAIGGVRFVVVVVVVVDSMVSEPLTDVEAAPEEPVSSELVLHPATKPANANAAKNCFIISFVLCFQPFCALNLPHWRCN